MIALRTILALFILLASIIAPVTEVQANTGWQTRELLGFAEIRTIVPSPDGRYATFEVSRPLADMRRPHGIRTYSLRGFGPSDRSDVWLYDRQTNAAHKLVDGAADESASFAAVWSPTGAYLSFISTRGNRLHLEIYDVGTGTFHDPLHGVVEPYEDGCPVWLNAHVLLCATHPENAPDLTFARAGADATIDAAEAAWKTFRNGGTSVSVEDPNAPRPHPGTLVAVDASDWTSRALADGNVADVRVSPDRKLIAYLQLVGSSSLSPPGPLHYAQYALSGPWGRSDELYRLHVLRAGDFGNVKLGSGQNQFMQYQSLHWSASNALAYVTLCGRPAGDALRCPAILHFHNEMPAGTVQLSGRVTTGADVVWSNDGLLAYREAGPVTSQWWRLVDGRTGAVVRRIETPALVAGPLHGFISAGSGTFKSIGATNTVTSRIPSGDIVGNGTTNDYSMIDTGLASRFIVVDIRNAHRRFSFVESATGKVMGSVSCPGSYAAATSASMMYCLRSDDNGFQRLSVTSRGGTRTVASVNDFAIGRDALSYRFFQYTSQRGEPLSALAILPPQFRANGHYPAITYVYLGSMEHGRVAANFKLGDAENFGVSGSVVLLALRGFVVIVPSMPYTFSVTTPANPLLDLTNGVVPAVERAGAMGWINRNRVGVLGHSFGGFSAMGLITQTKIFKAAVAASGFSDVASRFGLFSPTVRYSNNSDGVLRNFGMYWSEFSQGRMGGPPWSDPERYIRNSPIFHAQNVVTPLLLFDSDMDGTNFEQSEEMFSALFRQGKRVKLVRYAGEDHVLQSAANVADSWDRIVEWFERYLR